MLLDIAVADAYGACFEFAPTGFVTEHNDPSKGYAQHPGRSDPAPGRYTDDTQMSIAIAEMLVGWWPAHGHKKLEDGRPVWMIDSWTRLAARAFISAYQRDPRAGYSSGLEGLLRDVIAFRHTPTLTEKADALAQCIASFGPRSDTNGAAMRAVPIGVLPDLAAVKHIAEQQGRVTHRGPAVDAAVAVACASHYCIYRLGRMEGLGHWLNQQVSGYFWDGRVRDEPITNNKGTLATDTVRAAIWFITHREPGSYSRSKRLLLKRAVAIGGDTDSVAAVALGIASGWPDFEDDLPLRLIEELEPGGAYGVEYLKQLDEKLLALVQR